MRFLRSGFGYMSSLEIIDILRHDIYGNTWREGTAMELIEIPELPRLHGEEAIVALYDFMNELEKERSEELPEKQVKTLVKFTKGLIFSIETEMLSEIRRRALTEKTTNEARFGTRIKKAFGKHVPHSVSQALRFP